MSMEINVMESKKKLANWNISEEYESLRETLDAYQDALEQLVDSLDSSAIDFEALDEYDLQEALERCKKLYENS